MDRTKVGVGGLALLALCAGSAGARAATNLVMNGNFESYTAPTVSVNGTPTTVGQLGTNMNGPSGYSNSTGGGTLSNWQDAGYAFVFQSGAADTTGSYSNQYSNFLKLWGTNDGGTTAIPASSPTGGNFIGLDGDPSYDGALYQTVGGLAVGATYSISFYFAGASQYGYSGQPTTEQLLVGIGSAVPASNGQYQFATPVLTTPDKGFTPWTQVNYTFVANATSEVLSFLSVGTPAGAPPFALLDGVSVTYTPEPATWAVMVAGLVAVAVGGRFWHRGRVAGTPESNA